jgi:flagellar basal-body rod protein FlgB
MDYSSLPLFGLMKAKLNYASTRQGMLAQNIANTDTPGYRAKDVKEPDFSNVLAQQSGLQMTKTSTKHMGSQTGAVNMNVITRDSTYEQSPTGNNVVIEEEMQRVAQNQAEYQKTLNLYHKTVTMFKTALGSPNSGG